MQNKARSAGRSDPLTSIVRTAFVPAATTVGRGVQGASDWTYGVFAGGRLAAENRALKSQLLALSTYAEQIERLTIDLNTARALDNLPPVPGKQRIAGRIISHSPFENLVLLNIGSKEGVAVGCPVVVAQDLLGTVQTVEEHRSQVMLLKNAQLELVALDMSRNPPSVGWFSKFGVVFFDPKAPVEVGDVIATSGFSDKIPRGLIMGRVIFVEDSPELGTRRAIFDPAVSIGQVSEVVVLR